MKRLKTHDWVRQILKSWVMLGCDNSLLTGWVTLKTLSSGS